MTIAGLLDTIREAAELTGVAELARKADVPLSTVASLKDRNWTHQGAEMLDRLGVAAADVLKHREAYARRRKRRADPAASQDRSESA